MYYEVWDDVAGRKVKDAMPESDAKAYALEQDPQGERLFLEDGNGDQTAWNASLKQWDAV